LWNELGELTETCIYNLYLEIDGDLLTPAKTCGLLAGTYRQMLLNEGKVREAVLRLEHLERASRIFVSNSVRGMQEARLVHQAAREVNAFQA
ncbi:MAG: aminotransferase class IV, partial [Gammaproteobacteria bacterium]